MDEMEDLDSHNRSLQTEVWLLQGQAAELERQRSVLQMRLERGEADVGSDSGVARFREVVHTAMRRERRRKGQQLRVMTLELDDARDEITDAGYKLQEAEEIIEAFQSDVSVLEHEVRLLQGEVEDAHFGAEHESLFGEVLFTELEEMRTQSLERRQDRMHRFTPGDGEAWGDAACDSFGGMLSGKPCDGIGRLRTGRAMMGGLQSLASPRSRLQSSHESCGNDLDRSDRLRRVEDELEQEVAALAAARSEAAARGQEAAELEARLHSQPTFGCQAQGEEAAREAERRWSGDAAGSCTAACDVAERLRRACAAAEEDAAVAWAASTQERQEVERLREAVAGRDHAADAANRTVVDLRAEIAHLRAGVGQQGGDDWRRSQGRAPQRPKRCRSAQTVPQEARATARALGACSGGVRAR